jgi:hypothetical protein
MSKPQYHCYGRFSSKPQEDGSSEERQIEGRRARAVALGADFVDVYVDGGKSGNYAHHLDELPRGHIIGVDTHSRLGRLPPGDQITQLKDFENGEFVVVPCAENYRGLDARHGGAVRELVERQIFQMLRIAHHHMHHEVIAAGHQESGPDLRGLHNDLGDPEHASVPHLLDAAMSGGGSEADRSRDLLHRQPRIVLQQAQNADIRSVKGGVLA